MVVCAWRNYFNVGAGIVADSSPEAEYEETLANAVGSFTYSTTGVSLNSWRIGLEWQPA